MPRKRLRNYPLIVYKYWAKPIDKIPEVLWRKVHLMQETWNGLVALREKVQEETKEKSKEEKQEIWGKFWLESRAYVNGTGLDWVSKGEILDRFQTASRRAVKEKGSLRMSRGLRKIMIAHRYTGGGIPADKLFNGRGWRFKLDALDPAVYKSKTREACRQRLTVGMFGIDADNVFHFKTILHRPIPDNAIVKSVRWCGQFDRNLHPNNRWKWSIQIVAEQPPQDLNRQDSLACGLDLGWRIMAEGQYIRVGMVKDSAGNLIEIRLPLVGTGTRNTRRSFVYKKYEDFFSIRALDAKIGELVDGCKDRLEGLLPADKRPNLGKMRQGGIHRIFNSLQDVGEYPDAQAAILEFEKEVGKLYLIRATVTNRLLGRRQNLYQNLAAWLTKTYRVVVWEKDLKIKEMAEQEDKSYALEGADKYRQWAAPGNLRLLLKYAAKKNGCALLDGETAYSTLTCWECGALVEENTGALILECPNGHKWDQDEGAARNLLSQTHQLLEQNGEENPLKFTGRSSEIVSPVIPEVLRKVAVLCS